MGMVCSMHYRSNASEVLNRSHLRPMTVNARVEPHHLQAWRVSHRMLGPCCICPMADDAQPDFKEAAIYQVRGASTGRQYVASCARDLCGYFGKRDVLSGYDSLPLIAGTKSLWSPSTTARNLEVVSGIMPIGVRSPLLWQD